MPSGYPVKEHPVFFGASKTVFGILTEPDKSNINKELPAVVLLNAGLMHHIGPFRMNVMLARSLAQQGFIVLRIDCSGKGDSPPSTGALSNRATVRQDINDAFDYVQKHKSISKFVLVGLCSGADDAFDVSGVDPRVSGLILLDGYAYRTPKFYIYRYGPKIFKLTNWIQFVRRMLRESLGGSGKSSDFEEDIFGMTFPPKSDYERGLSQLLDNGSRILIVHSSGWHEYYNYENQFWDSFPALQSRDGIAVMYFPKADHTYSLSSDRNLLIDHLVSWCHQSYDSDKEP
jgi:hypothetical protein